MPAAEHVERQVAVAIVVAVEEPPFLMAVQRVVGGVEVDDDLFGRLRVRLEEEVDEQRLDRRRLVADLSSPLTKSLFSVPRGVCDDDDDCGEITVGTVDQGESRRRVELEDKKQGV